MMDTSNLLSADGLEGVNQNGVHEELLNSGKDGIVLNVDLGVTETIETTASNRNFENFNQSDSVATDYSSKVEVKEGSNDNVDGNNVTISKEEEVEIINQTEQVKAQKGPVKNKNAKTLSPRGVHASSAKKSTDGKNEKATSVFSNGTFALESHPRQPVKNKSFSDKQTRLSKHPGKSNAASSEASMEKTRPQSLKKGPLDNLQGEAESSTPTAEDAKPRRMGTLPNYGFSFRCDERAERRKEFYTKLEEKIHAKEVEESNMQAKTKETQEAEIKKLRKSLGFKATPMPSFYQEPPPARTELKKMPTTRAKSPKLGRRKSSTYSESEGNPGSSARQGRLSLDEKVSHSNPSKEITPVHQKKPQRRSLPPRLNSEKITSSNLAAARASSKLVNDEKILSSVKTEVTTFSNATGGEKVEMAAAIEENNALSNETSEALPLNIEPGEAKSPVNGDLVNKEKSQLALVQEPIAAEH
ncbi:protein WVD2-like 5 [Abrus precatorius]|uniref:Protein WVD2-like 5 n=1 Tax=Abrus precatorius TaxID=3816 RepID=A0A8B8LDL1_ABRPR|nr:protein WVD2-like 5 [Abrus precatorius]XP_027354316.1 protein WVD2-like 5 [Abrus precatorius]XP_027354317.1 protein WVD2-like 5 [Abrus precatorius]XP_027354318.1 protein WVD2-like 5 [Abrus precatorius]XP_027354319.1 protein WVD2-like 5 [Abrus precatorius]XP_027354320.1 protein WVD2-like 5 [Abrus precatorius]